MSTKRVRVLSVTVFVLFIISVLAIPPLILGGYTRSLEKVDFFDAYTPYNYYDKDIILAFGSIRMSDDNLWAVWVDPNNATVRMDSSILGTVISASPTFFQRIRKITLLYKAKSVVVWVQNQSERERWENFLRAAQDSKNWKANTETLRIRALP